MTFFVVTKWAWRIAVLAALSILAGFVIQIEVEHHRTVAEFKAAQKKLPVIGPTAADMLRKDR